MHRPYISISHEPMCMISLTPALHGRHVSSDLCHRDCAYNEGNSCIGEVNMARRLMIVLLVTIALLTSLAVQPAAAQSNVWTAEYFNNTALSGSPALIRSETLPNGEWNYGSPAPGIVADYFSVRWTTTAFLNGGTYQISVRADDGVRVYVDGVLYINQWQLAAGRYYQASIPLASGNHTFVVEYFEAAEVALMLYNFDLLAPVPPPGAPQARVTAQYLNLRALPNAAAAVLDVISQGQVYPIAGRNANNTWVEINVNGTFGWINTSFAAISSLAGVPITDGSGGIPPTPIPPPPVGASATVTAYLLNVRNAPNPFSGGVVTQITRGQTYPVIGRNLDTSWVQINVNGLIGWVRTTWVSLSNMAGVPVTSNTTNPSPQPGPVNTYATVRAYFLNVRSGPFFGAPVLMLVNQGQTYPVVGRNTTSTWIQINIGGTIGWVRSTWIIAVPNLNNVPVTG